MNAGLPLLVAAALPALAWLYTLIAVPWLSRHIRGMQQLPLPDAPLPRLSVVVPARDEARKIEAALLTLLAQDYEDVEVLVVNDRSTDGTADILRCLEPAQPRLRVITVDDLPDGWLGKNHALQKGLDAASGEFLLFTDADVHFAPGVLRRAVAHMQAGALDHLACLPAMINARPSLLMMLPAFAVFFQQLTQPWKVTDPESKHSIGIGAFNLVRRQALLQAGGFRPIRLRPDDDLMLGRLMKSAGCRADFVMADRQVMVEWYATAGEAIRGLEKNAFAQFEYRALPTVVLMLLTLYIVFMPFAGLLLLPGYAGWISLAGVVAMLGFAMLITHNMHWNPLWGLLFPVGAVLVVYATLRSMLLALWRGGIVWRDTFYSLSQLRKNRL